MSDNSSPTEPGPDHFVQVPRSLYAGLSAEEYRAWQQVYQTAYAKAWAQVHGQDQPPSVDSDLSFDI